MSNDHANGTISRRQLIQTLGVAAVGAPLAAVLGQGRCRLKLGDPGCDTTAIKPVFDPTGFRTIGLDHIRIRVADYQKEAAFYTALMGWKLRTDDGHSALMDVGDWGAILLEGGYQPPPPDTTAGAGRGGRGGAPPRALVDKFAFVIDNWDAKKVEAALRARGLSPVAENGPGGFESFHVKDPDGWDLQICNSAHLDARKRTPATAKLTAPLPFESTGWKTVWLDHISFGVTNYKETASFYDNLLGWKPTYDEGSQNELMIGDVGDIIIRGGNPLTGQFSRDGRGNTSERRARIDHISFGITPWDTDGVKAALESRGLRARIDTSTEEEIHVAQFKSYHTTTPNGYDLQISYVTRENRLALPNAVRPRKPG